MLSTTEEKLECIAESGLEYVAVLPFTSALAALDPTEFVERILLERFCLQELVIGYDHGFGRGRAGDVKVLRELGERHDFTVAVVEAISVDGLAVSSSAIRRAVSYGDLASAQRLLGRRYAFIGRVGHGNERGRLLGFPTLNIALPSQRKLLPPPGVYAVFVQSALGRKSQECSRVLDKCPCFGSPVAMQCPLEGLFVRSVPAADGLRVTDVAFLVAGDAINDVGRRGIEPASPITAVRG